VGTIPTPPPIPPPVGGDDGGQQTEPPTATSPTTTSTSSAPTSTMTSGEVVDFDSDPDYTVSLANLDAGQTELELIFQNAGLAYPGSAVSGDNGDCVAENGMLSSTKLNGCCTDQNYTECPKSKMCAWITQTHGGGNPREPYDGALDQPANPCDTTPACDRCGGADSEENCLADVFMSKKYKGCKCANTPSCPDPKPRCSECDGQEGFCTKVSDAQHM